MRTTSMLVMCFMVLGALPLSAGADQEPGDNAGKLVFVQQANSKSEVSGRLLEFGPDTVTLISEGKRIELALDTVRRIQARGDSLKNGALIGALVFGGGCALACFQGTSSAGMWLTAVAINGGLGALIGVGIDALHEGRTTIYRQPSDPKRIAFGYSFRW